MLMVLPLKSSKPTYPILNHRRYMSTDKRYTDIVNALTSVSPNTLQFLISHSFPYFHHTFLDRGLG